MTSLLRLDRIGKRFGSTLALDQASLTLRAGEVRALLGENGAGKSTLLAIVGGLLQPDVGSLQLEGRAYAPRSPREARQAGIALIHQELSLFPQLRVYENVFLGREPRRLGVFDRAAARRATRAALAEFGHPDIDPDAELRSLPLGARQVVEICRAMAANARVVLMDEPTSSLPRGDVERLFVLVRRLAGRGVAVLYISHFLEETRAVAASFTVLRDGRTVADGVLETTNNEALIAAMVGRAVSELLPRPAPRQPGEARLAVRGLARPPLLREATFALRAGEVLGVFGLMGSGRSELLRALFGLDRPTAGELQIDGRPCRLDEPPDRRLRRGLGYLSEDRKGDGLLLARSVADNVTLTRLSRCSRFGVVNPSLQRRQALQRAQELNVKLSGPEQPAHTLSGGNQQKLALARLLHQDAGVLLLDEPTRGVDVASRAQIHAAIAGAAASGKAVLLVSSYLPELLAICDRIAVMSRGRLSQARPVSEWSAELALEAAIGA